MCGRYTLYEPKEIFKRFDVEPDPSLDLRDNYNTAPGQFMPVITYGDDGSRHVEIMKWGLVPHWAKDTKIGYKLINARAESAFEKPMWRGAIAKYRCLVPARGFYEWRKPGLGPTSETEASGKPSKTTKQPFFIHPTDQELFAFAGIYSLWNDPDEGPLLSFSIMTTVPNKDMHPIHDRMPVILHPTDEKAWLDPTQHDRSELEHFLAPYPDGRLDVYEVSADVNTPKNNDEHLIYKLDQA